MLAKSMYCNVLLPNVNTARYNVNA